MQKTVLLLLNLSLLIFNSCSKKQVEEILPENSPCSDISFILPTNSYEKRPDKYNGAEVFLWSYTYYDIDRAKKNADSIINISLSDKVNIDSLLLVFDNYQETLLNDSLENEKWIGICMKIPQIPLNVFSKIQCNLQMKEGKVYCYLDLRYDEFFIFFCNKKNMYDREFYGIEKKLYRDFNEKEYAEYLKNADYDALKNIEDLTKYYKRYSLRTTSEEKTVIQYMLKSADTTVNFNWNNSNATSQQLDSLDNLISGFKNKYQKTFEIQHSDTIITCERKALSVHFDKNVPLIEVLRIINMLRKSELIFDVDCVENRVNICTLCSEDELRFGFNERI